MKIKILLLLLCSCSLVFSQNQINSFYGTNGFVSTDVTAATALNHGTGGANQTWSFSGFLPLGTSTYSYVSPTTTESSTYPGTNNIILTSSLQGAIASEGRMYTKNTAGSVSITGLNSADLTINFNGGTNGSGNATLGVFPMTYPFSNTDNTVSGSYVNGTNTGTFSGTLTTTVDGYGVLNLPDYGYTGNVTRLKTVLSVTLYLSIFPIGTASQTTYAYYDPSDSTNNFKLRSLNTIVVAAAAGINQNNTTLEIGIVPNFALTNFNLNSIWIKNPIENSIQINSPTPINNATITITDMLGKKMYESKNETINHLIEIPISLTKGIYFINIGNENGNVTKKLIKN